MEKSQNGWTASSDPSEIDIKLYTIPGTDRKIRLRRHVAPILLAFAAEFDKMVEDIEQGALDDWGYNYRPVRGHTDTLSNHASGTAMDLNATQHVLGKEDTFTKKQQAVIQMLIKKYGIAWGGNYKNRKDDMHFEIVESPLKVKARIVRMGLKPDGTYKKAA